MTATDTKRLNDLVEFARLELVGNDIEPWAQVIRWLYDNDHATQEQALWLVKLYNSYDSIESAWQAYERWPTVDEWGKAADGLDAATYPIMRERRNLLGGRINQHFDSYLGHLTGHGGSQLQWIMSGVSPKADKFDAFIMLMPHLRKVWGVGRQTAFEWAEFVAKVADAPIETPDAYLWESSGPRRALQRLYGNDTPTPEWLNARAAETKQMLSESGVELSWWDFETVICDFNVMRDGRYYPGQHIGAIRGEVEALTGRGRELLGAALDDIIPANWRSVPPGIDMDARKVYRDSGRVYTPPMIGAVL